MKKMKLYYPFLILVGGVASSMVIGMVISFFYAKKQYVMISGIANQLVLMDPRREQDILQSIKAYAKTGNEVKLNYLEDYGFRVEDFWEPFVKPSILLAIICPLLIAGMVFIIVHRMNQTSKKRIQGLTDYLVRVNRGKEAPILTDREDLFSILEDEIYKTVTELKSAKEKAITERKNFSDSLTGIAHQIKTPITAITVTAQLYEQEGMNEAIKLIRKQTIRLNHLVNDLLTISKIDAGVLELKQNPVDVYTLLELSVEALEEIIHKKQIEVNLPNDPQVTFMGELERSVEAFINLTHNCIEHTGQGGKIEFSYEANPLYVEIRIMDNGEGFDEKEIPYLFERFYQGTNKVKTGTGIGLSMAKSIIELQKGFIVAKNLSQGGACFIVRFYSH